MARVLGQHRTGNDAAMNPGPRDDHGYKGDMSGNIVVDYGPRRKGTEDDTPWP